MNGLTAKYAKYAKSELKRNRASAYCAVAEEAAECATMEKPLSPTLSPLVPRGERENTTVRPSGAEFDL